MDNSKQYVLQRFTGASVRKVGETFHLENVPGLACSGVTEALAWEAAEGFLRDPVHDRGRAETIHKKVIAAFDSLEGQACPPMALKARLEERGFSTSESGSAINEALVAGVLVQTATGSIRRP